MLPLVLCGLGSAGRSRLRAAQAMPFIEVAGLISRRPELSTLSWADFLSNPNLPAVAISTENSDHPYRVEEALRAHKHVLCDYPLAFSSIAAKALFDLAASQKKILHAEHIGLLTSEHKRAKAQALALGPLQEGHYHFQGNWNEKLANPSYSGPLPFLALSRLVQLADLFGPFKLTVKDYGASSSHFILDLILSFTNGGNLEFKEERREGLPRGRKLQAQMQGGSLRFEAKPKNENLFGQDLGVFYERVQGRGASYLDKELLVGVIGQLEKIS